MSTFGPDLISGFLNLYVISVGMRILGLLNASNQDELGWLVQPSTRQ
jgi:hypothetical protein